MTPQRMLLVLGSLVLAGCGAPQRFGARSAQTTGHTVPGNLMGAELDMGPAEGFRRLTHAGLVMEVPQELEAHAAKAPLSLVLASTHGPLMGTSVTLAVLGEEGPVSELAEGFTRGAERSGMRRIGTREIALGAASAVVVDFAREPKPLPMHGALRAVARPGRLVAAACHTRATRFEEVRGQCAGLLARIDATAATRGLAEATLPFLKEAPWHEVKEKSSDDGRVFALALDVSHTLAVRLVDVATDQREAPAAVLRRYRTALEEAERAPSGPAGGPGQAQARGSGQSQFVAFRPDKRAAKGEAAFTAEFDEMGQHPPVVGATLHARTAAGHVALTCAGPGTRAASDACAAVLRSVRPR